GGSTEVSGDTLIIPTAATSSGTPGANRAKFTANLAAGTYRVWIRCQGPNTSSDSFWGRFGTGAFIKSNNMTTGTSWKWLPMVNSDAAGAVATFTLPAGKQTFEIANREQGFLIDKIYITSKGDAPFEGS